MWCWRRMEISWADRVIREVLYRVKEKMNIIIRLKEIRLPGYIMRRNWFLKHVIEGMIEGTRRRGRSRKQLLDDFKERRRYHDDIVCYFGWLYLAFWFEIWINYQLDATFICVLSARHVSGLYAHLQEQWMLQYLTYAAYVRYCNIHCSWRWAYKPETCRAESTQINVASSW